MHSNKMKAIVCTKYVPPEVLQLKDVEKPAQKNKKVMIRIYTTTVSSGDCRIRSLNFTRVSFMQRILARLVQGISKPGRPA